MRKLLGFLPAFALVMGLSQVANAAEVTRVASSFDQEFNGNAFDLHFGVSYDFDFKKAAILREWGSGGKNRLARDLIYRQFRHTVTPTLEIGLWHDISVYVGLPVVVSDNRNYEFDQDEGGDCVFPDNPGTTSYEAGSATCVNKTNSTSIRDGIVPRDGFDAFEDGDPYGQFTDLDSTRIFNAPTRRGLDQLNVGMKFGILSQARKSHLPNWVIGLEGRFAVGKAMTMSRAIQDSDPAGNHRVGRGMHELGAWTTLSRRYRFLDPFFGAHWRYAFRAGGNTQFENYGDTQGKVQPQSETGAYFGAEIVPWENEAQGKKVSIILQGSAVLHYNGRGYSEVWELLADSPALVGDYSPGQGDTCSSSAALAFAAANPSDPSGYVDAAGGDCASYNGITTIQDYGTFGLNAGLNFYMGPYARLNFGVDMTTDTRHYVTVASRGDGDNAGDPDVVDADTADVNPVRRDIVDSVGRRYAVDDVFNVQGYFNFLLTF
ncbi:hypothetical protein G6O69_11400 [Pseudenhygromyxa sp. WMMC2535]|uniref:hypothetical protein n=1 Tax=Pseudenhygromyxa sp. WMMC2535 TaxID=2712867 RepID=UPI00155231DD|nr:hypothetical protein [Pseudenhygromyxa sp. WMMC2535]NVB38438.1 hypothetical protein [Pseudenhygromyxa sp. WMMC2535]